VPPLALHQPQVCVAVCATSVSCTITHSGICVSAPLHSQQLQSLSNGLRVWVAVCVAACVLQWVLQHQRLRIAGRKKHTKVMHHFCVVVLFLYTVNGKRQQPRPSISWHLVHPPHAHPHLTLHTPTQRQALRRGMGIGGSRYNATRGKHCNEGKTLQRGDRQ